MSDETEDRTQPTETEERLFAIIEAQREDNMALLWALRALTDDLKRALGSRASGRDS